LSSNLISGFAKIANLSNNISKYVTGMHLRAMKVQQNGQKCHVVIPSQKSKNSKNSINFFLMHSCRTNYVALSMIVTSHCLSIHTQKSQ